MIAKIQRNLSDYNMIQRGDKILVALSGGPDSVCLFYVLLELKKEIGFKLHLAHLNHGIRREAGTDANYVKRLSHNFTIPITIAKANIPEIVKEGGGSIETAAREKRYQFLIKTAREVKANKIAFGHNQDDQIETFLLNFLRGAGPGGLRGMPAKRKLARLKNGKDIYLIRPLIRVNREEIMTYLHKKRLRPRIDVSNLDCFYKRNKIRWKLLPLLQNEYNPNIKELIVRMTRVFEEENVFWRNYLRVISKDIIVRKNKKEIYVDIENLLVHPGAVQNRIIQLALKEFPEKPKEITYEHIIAVRKLCSKKRGRKILNFPGGIQAVKEYGKLILEKGKPATNHHFDLKAKLEISSEAHKKSKVTAHIKKLRYLPSGERFKAILDKDKLRFPLIVRNRYSGDRFQPLGFNTFTKLKKYFINRKVLLSKRRSTPLLIDSYGKIAWVIGMEIADWAKVTEKTKNLLRLKYIL